MKWFRFYSEALHDPKVQRLPAALFKHWINLLCLANESEERGDLPCVDDVAFALRVSSPKAKQILADLHRAGLLVVTEEGSYRHHGWARRQRETDDVAARVRKHRASKATQKNSDVTGCNVTDALPETKPETLHETPEKRSRATDTDTDTEISITSPNGLVEEDPPEPTPKPKRLKRVRPPDPLFNAIAEAWKGEPYHEKLLTPPQATLVGMVTAELRAVGATPEEVPAEWRRIRAAFDNPGPRALSAHWKTDIANGKQPERIRTEDVYPRLA